jgi:hypothetical protein
MDIPNELTCRTCGESKLLTAFPKSSTNKYGRKATCLNPCYKEKNKQYYQKIKGDTWKMRYSKKKELLVDPVKE